MNKLRFTLFLFVITFLSAALLAEKNGSIHIFAAKGDIKRVRAMVKEDPSLVNAKDKEGAAPLHHAAAAGKKQVAEFLLNNRADVNAKKKNGVTPLHVAASLGRTDVVALLISRKANTNACDDLGRTPLSLAEANGRKEVVKLLLAGTPKVVIQETGHTPKPADLAVVSRQLVELLSRREFAGVCASFDENLRKTLSPEGLEATWDSLFDQIGQYRGQLGVRKGKVDKQESVTVTCLFEDARLDVQFVFSDERQVTSLALLPVMP